MQDSGMAVIYAIIILVVCILVGGFVDGWFRTVDYRRRSAEALEAIARSVTNAPVIRVEAREESPSNGWQLLEGR